jgi:hypothetical protein
VHEEQEETGRRRDTCVHSSVNDVLSGPLFGEKEDGDELDKHRREREASSVVTRKSLFDQSSRLLSRAKVEIAAEKSTPGELREEMVISKGG